MQPQSLASSNGLSGSSPTSAFASSPVTSDEPLTLYQFSKPQLQAVRNSLDTNRIMLESAAWTGNIARLKQFIDSSFHKSPAMLRDIKASLD